LQHGKEGHECYIEIDVLDYDHDVVTVRRVLNSESDTSSWFLGGRKAKKDEVLLCMKGLDIDVKNLCSFMPQDKVGAFTQYTAREILEKTLMCIKSEDGVTSLREVRVGATQSYSSCDKSSECVARWLIPISIYILSQC
jgi:chromosome segregation ATPase